MHPVSKAKQYWYFTTGLKSFFKDTISLPEAKKIVRWRMAHREQSFLSVVKKAIYGYEKSPYLKLLHLAHCEFADLEAMVKKRGIEPTLRQLKEEGVYISFEEFKGRKPALRSGKTFHFREGDFDNPYLSRCYEAKTSGSTGAGTRASIDLDFVREGAVYYVLRLTAYDLMEAPVAFWLPTLPAGVGMACLLRYSKIGKTPLRWFSPVDKRSIRPTLRNRMLTSYVILMGRLSGMALPRPEFVDMSQALVIARWLSELLEIYPHCFFGTFVSAAARISVAARKNNLNLQGVTFSVGGEPLTEAKLKSIAAVGARVIPGYACTELGNIASGCAHPLAIDDVHLFDDTLALIQCPRYVERSKITVNSFLFTSFLTASPKIMLNAEIDDQGVVEKRNCGCLLGELGFTTHLHHIRSFSKLTSEGMTLMGAEVVRIIEEVLPRRCGGDATSYQVLEEEDRDGITRISILVDPELGTIDEEMVKEVFFQEIRKVTRATPVIWKQVGTIQVKRQDPLPGNSGKIMSLRIKKV